MHDLAACLTAAAAAQAVAGGRGVTQPSVNAGGRVGAVYAQAHVERLLPHPGWDGSNV